ncbi:helix-turn-helix transcriptional regulator [Tamlana fucoidanivorans]|uniref:Helix-turn-helix transcriptional regulator n=1 Tax=Allotamlana fucoidanivorans TaxID=2583814 RepID=A0A5C4SI34_9FLAO|nr:AraC family transcriptional regulator [Tamlana fucoidanivorans]TNJ43140.1 helix-turn-helix transcriptional regulator [Tamlana fucoidanivorans]
MNDFLLSLKLKLLHVGFEKLDSNWNYQNVISPFVRLILVTKGRAILSHSNQIFNLEPGFLYLVPNHTLNSYSCETHHEQYYAGFFEEVKLGLSVFDLKHFNYQVKATDQDVILFKRLLEIHPYKAVKDKTPKSHINHSLLNSEIINTNMDDYIIETQGILSILFSRFINNKDILLPKNVGFKGDLTKVLAYIGKHIDKNITVKHLAEYCDLSPDHFTKCFFSKFEITPSRYMQHKRIERAQFLLSTTKDSIPQIAAHVGMPNTSYFSRKFKALTGSSPGSYRKQQLLQYMAHG